MAGALRSRDPGERAYRDGIATRPHSRRDHACTRKKPYGQRPQGLIPDNNSMKNPVSDSRTERDFMEYIGMFGGSLKAPSRPNRALATQGRPMSRECYACARRATSNAISAAASPS